MSSTAVASPRARRVGDQIQRELAALLAREVADPRLQGLLVTEVEMSSDLAHAKVYVVAAAGADAAKILAGLQAAAGFLRRGIGRSMRLRRVPALHFVVDDTMDKAARIEALLREAGPAKDPER